MCVSSAVSEDSQIARAVLNTFTPAIRKVLTNDSEIQELCQLKTRNRLRFHEFDCSFDGSEFYRAMRAAVNGHAPVTITSADGRSFRIIESVGENGEFSFESESDRNVLRLPNFNALSSDRDTRIEALDTISKGAFLSKAVDQKWRNTLFQRPLSDDEVDLFLKEVRSSGRHFAQTLREKLRAGSVGVSDFVPEDRYYFEALVGGYDGSDNIQTYIDNVIVELFEQRIAYNSTEGLTSCLCLAAHSGLIDAIPVQTLSQRNLETVFEELEEGGDLISILGAVELGVRLLPQYPGLEGYILNLMKKLTEEARDQSAFELLSAVFVLVDGQMAFSRQFVSDPPFYRRLAASAHSALILRELAATEWDGDSFVNWCLKERRGPFYIQSLIDLRKEPRWVPDLIVADQLHAEFLGRLINLFSRHKSLLPEGELYRLFQEIVGREYLGNTDTLSFFLPGPLEGSLAFSPPLPEELGAILESSPNLESIEPATFIALVNSSALFTVSREHSEIAAKALAAANYHMSNLEDESDLLTLLVGLARVAACSRSTTLADELRIFERNYRSKRDAKLPIDISIRACLIASASYSDYRSWIRFTGDWLTEMAFGDLSSDEARHFYLVLGTLLHLAPDLWLSCSKAQAALASVNYGK